jgi:hypothetical protein
MNYPKTLIVAALVALQAAAASQSEDLVAAAQAFAANTRNRPNIVFIFSDDHAPHAIGAYANDKEMPYGQWMKGIDTTPRIDQLARE